MKHEDKKITILALSWRDIKAPKKGGAEIHTHEMLKRLDKKRFYVIHFSPMFENASSKEVIDNITYLRKGNIFSVILYAEKYYKKHKKDINFVIDQCNTHRFFTKFWVSKKKRIFYIHQLTREIWDINLMFPLNKIGKALESWMLKLNKNDYTITLSNSTKQDLIDLGFDQNKLFMIPIGLSEEIQRFSKDQLPVKKEHTFIYVGRYAKYKGINYCVQALALIKEKYSDAKLWICGKKDENYINKELLPLCYELGLICKDVNETIDADVLLWGFVSEEQKYKLMQEARALLFPSIREGWGIIVSEAAYLGTPSIVFNAPGARDAINYGKAGYLCTENTAYEIANLMIETLENIDQYEKIVKEAYTYTSQFLWELNESLLEAFIDNILKQQDKEK